MLFLGVGQHASNDLQSLHRYRIMEETLYKRFCGPRPAADPVFKVQLSTLFRQSTPQ